MEITVNEVSEVQREIEITATAAELQPHFEKAYVEYRPKVELRGFRKGKVPIEMVKKLYADLIERESLQQIATEFYKQAVKDRNLKPIGEPALIDLNYKRGERAWFKIQYDVRPSIQLKNYKGIKVEKVVHTVTDIEVASEILRLRRMNSTTEPADAVAGEEFIVTADLQELDDAGTPLIGKKTDGIRLYLADEELEQPFKEALKNATVGGEYRVKFDHQHVDHTHNVHTAIRVKKIEKVQLPDLNDEFVKKITKDKMTTVADFTKELRDDLEAYWMRKMERQVLNSLTAELLRLHEFKVPDALVRSVLEGLVEEVKNDYPNRKLPADFEYEKFFEQNRAYAIYQARWTLLREELIKAENIDVADADFERLAEDEAPKIKIDKDRLINYYKSSDQTKDRLKGEKLIKVLLASAKITEVPEPKQ